MDAGRLRMLLAKTKPTNNPIRIPTKTISSFSRIKFARSLRAAGARALHGPCRTVRGAGRLDEGPTPNLQIAPGRPRRWDWFPHVESQQLSACPQERGADASIPASVSKNERGRPVPR